MIDKPIWVIVGTRPEVIKQAALYNALKNKFGQDKVALIGTGQHRELLTTALEQFDLKLDYNFDLMSEAQTPAEIAAKIILKFNEIFSNSSRSATKDAKPKWVIVQGDTTTAAMAAWVSFLNKINVIHNEAGLRTCDLYNPFPEEANRKIISSIATLHLAPTIRARDVLTREGVSADKIFVTGNTGIDAFRLMLNKQIPENIKRIIKDNQNKNNRSIVLLTAHRRESEGEPVIRWFENLKEFVNKHSDLHIIYPMHPNNVARPWAKKILNDHPQISLLEPLNYLQTVHAIANSRFVITDSGGIQEEAATINIPVVVCRKVTERMEAVDAGIAKLTSFDSKEFFETLEWANDLGKKFQNNNQDNNQKNKQNKTLLPNNIYGDGFSSEKIAQILYDQYDQYDLYENH
ncbi:MAG: UDP-N-acetylglucosamine 2-epimerase (non-hydrolyzing) [Oligoflexia bacterium]|nr:UDP-N-acetylglucosamine 2-epimerase (non-hydrolyzing) [Oligoflexia bacterium]